MQNTNRHPSPARLTERRSVSAQAPDAMNRAEMAALARALGLGALGGTLFALAGMPAAFLSGAILATAAASLAGIRLAVPRGLRNTSFVALGIIIGATVDRQTVALLPQWPVSMAALGLALAALLILLPRYFQVVHGLDRPTSRLVAVPGAMTQVIAMTEDLPVDARRVVVLHSIRLAILMILVPAAFGAALPSETAAATRIWLGPWQILAMACAAGLGVALAARFRLPSPWFSGALIAAALLSGGGAVEGRVGGPVVDIAFLVLGATIGTHFAGVGRRYLADCLRIGFGGIVVAILITSVAAWPVAQTLGLPFVQIWLAFAPGGFDSMAALALSLGVDPAFVAGHQFARLMALYALIPFLFRRSPADGTP